MSSLTPTPTAKWPSLAIFDKVPAPVKHWVIAFLAVIVWYLGKAIIEKNGLSGVDWVATLKAAVDAAAVGFATVAVIAVLPFFADYGINAKK
jgi:hypothetical protein